MITESELERLLPVYDARITSARAPSPFLGYDEILEEVAVRSGKGRGERVLDLDVGTGNLAAHFVAMGCKVSAILHERDSSLREMLHSRLPELTLYDERVTPRAEYDAVVLGYRLHERALDEQVMLIERVFASWLRPRGGVMLVGDVGFEEEQGAARYFGAGEPMGLCFAALRDVLVPRRYKVSWAQLSACGGVLKIKKR